MRGFEKVIGYEKEKEELMQLCDMAKNPEKYRSLGVHLPQGVLLHGAPGVGKTLMATAFVEEIGRKAFILRKDEANADFVAKIGRVFEQAKAEAPSVVFLDDLDKFAADSDMRNPEEFIAVQTAIDATKGSDVFVIATANNIRDLPSSLRRPGRFDRILEICVPNRREATDIVRHYLKDKYVADDVAAESVARLMDGNSCAALESVLNEAGIYAGYDNQTQISMPYVVRAVLRLIFEAEEAINETSVSDREKVAFHEAGHAVAALHFDPEGVGLISIRPSKSDACGVVQLLQRESYFGSLEQMRARVISLLAGKAAVELKYGSIDVGASSDLKRAGRIMQRFVTDYGTQGFACLFGVEHWTVDSERHADDITMVRNAMLERCYEEAKAILRSNWAFVETLSRKLVEKNTLIYEEIVALKNAA